MCESLYLAYLNRNLEVLGNKNVNKTTTSWQERIKRKIKTHVKALAGWNSES